MNIKQLRYFVAIVEQRSMSRASVELGVAQSALSLQISNLEASIGEKLLYRQSTGVIPTAAGQELYRHAVAISRQMERAEHDVRNAVRAAAGPVSLGLPSVVSELLALKLFEHVQEHLPSLQLKLFDSMSYMLRELVSQGRLDMTVKYEDKPYPGLVEEGLYREHIFMVFRAGETFPGDEITDLHDIQSYPVVLPSKDSGIRRAIERHVGGGDALQPIAEIDALHVLMEFAKRGHASTLLPASVLQPYLRGDNDAALRIVPTRLSRKVVLCTSEHLPPGRAALALREQLKNVILRSLARGEWLGIEAP